MSVVYTYRAKRKQTGGSNHFLHSQIIKLNIGPRGSSNSKSNMVLLDE